MYAPAAAIHASRTLVVRSGSVAIFKPSTAIKLFLNHFLILFVVFLAVS
jgi:hypothetical protein